MFDLYLITDPDAPGGLVETTRRALEGARPGRLAVQLRAKARSAEARLALGQALRPVTAAAGCPLLVNGDVSTARAIGADGVHLPEGVGSPAEVRAALGAAAVVGMSCHDLSGVRRAASLGASFAVLGPFAPTPGKAAPLGAAGFAEIVAEAGLPVLALGGIDAQNAGAAIGAGAAGVAVVRAVYGASDPARAVGRLLASLDTARASGR